MLAGSLNTSLEVMRQTPGMFSAITLIDFSGLFTASSELPPDLGSLLPELTTFACSLCSLAGAIPAGMLCPGSACAPVPCSMRLAVSEAVSVP